MSGWCTAGFWDCPKCGANGCEDHSCEWWLDDAKKEQTEITNAEKVERIKRAAKAARERRGI